MYHLPTSYCPTIRIWPEISRVSFRPLWCAAAEKLARKQINSDPAGVNQYQFIRLCLAGWINRNQRNVIEYPHALAHKYDGQAYNAKGQLCLNRHINDVSQTVSSGVLKVQALVTTVLA
jgi:hypothetical protein